MIKRAIVMHKTRQNVDVCVFLSAGLAMAKKGDADMGDREGSPPVRIA
jgi:hypothetical protein